MNAPGAAVDAATLDRAGIDPRLLDCWESTLALALVAAGNPDVATLLGSQWWFAAPEAAQAPVGLDREPQAARLLRLAGLRLRPALAAEGGPAGQCARELADGRLPLVVTDAFLLPWCPYRGVKHVEHSFAVTGVDPLTGALAVVDAYANRTEWGEAAPLTAWLDGPTAGRVAADPSTRVLVLDPGDGAGPTVSVLPSASARPTPAALLREDGAALAAWADTDPFAAFVAAGGAPEPSVAAFEAFCESCWTVERRRALYAEWLDRAAADPEAAALLPDGFAERFRERVVASWSAVNRFTYLALRRVRAGRGGGRGLTELLAAAAAAERELAAELAAAVAATPAASAPAPAPAPAEVTAAATAVVAVLPGGTA